MGDDGDRPVADPEDAEMHGCCVTAPIRCGRCEQVHRDGECPAVPPPPIVGTRIELSLAPTSLDQAMELDALLAHAEQAVRRLGGRLVVRRG